MYLKYLLLLSMCLSSVLAQDDLPDFDWDTLTRLDEYVHEDDGYWSYEVLETYPLDGVTCYILNMTSQIWIGEDWVDRYIWWHHFILTIPDGELRDTTAGVLAITGGSNLDPPPDPDHAWAAVAIAFANITRTVTGVIMQVPNQPSVFANDPDQESRSEDSLIAWTWRTAIDDPEKSSDWVARLPFTKAAKRGLDTMHDFTQTVRPETDLTRFGTLGPSKRGWTVWSLAATDQRVVVAAPLVFSLLNVEETFMKHYQALGGAWTFAFEPYYNEDLTYHILDIDDHPHLWDMEDMIRYRSRLTIPKLLIVATGDEFFLNQDSHYWWNLMTEPMYMMMNPNTQHILFPHYLRIFDTVASFWISILGDLPLPEVSWTRTQDEQSGEIVMSTDIMPAEDGDDGYLARAVRAETLQNDTRRDFRLQAGYPPELHPVFWFSQDVEHDGDGNFGHSVDVVEEEWVAHFIELEYEGPEGFSMILTSEVNIVPDTFPVDPCTTPEECYGYLT